MKPLIFWLLLSGCAAGISLLAAPVIGTFRGNAVTSELNAEIDLRVVADNEMNLAAGTVG